MKLISPAIILKKHLPEKSFDYCLDLLQRYPFKLKVKKARQTKAGDFCTHHGNSPVITINDDLNPFLFLTTFIHEFAHHAVHLVYGNKPLAHGKEWKLAFKTFMQPLMGMEIFPDDLQHALSLHLKDPMASSFSDASLTKIFRRYDLMQPTGTPLSQIVIGSTFKIGRKIFRKGSLRRTRVLCVEIKTGREYLVPRDMIVETSQ